MRRLELDFQRPRRPSKALQGLLLAIALVFAADVGRNYLDASKTVDALRVRLAEHPQPAPRDAGLLRVSTRPASPEELAGAREIIRRLSTPWGALFRALEASRIGTVAVSSVEPDPAERTVLVRGDAKNYLAALSFVANLRNQAALQDVRLVQHETAAEPAERPLHFTVSASWGGAR